MSLLLESVLISGWDYSIDLIKQGVATLSFYTVVMMPHFKFQAQIMLRELLYERKFFHRVSNDKMKEVI